MEAIATNRLHFADSSKTCRTLFYMNLFNLKSINQDFSLQRFCEVQYKHNCIKKQEKMLIIVELKNIGHRNINTGTTLQFKTLIK